MGGRTHVIQQGESTTRIAFQDGFFPDTVWNDPANEALRKKRSDMNVLMPGDELFVPDKRAKEEKKATGQTHRFKRKGVPEKLRVRFFDLYGKPLANEEYVLDLDGTESKGKLDGDGWLDVYIPPDARTAVILVGPKGSLARATMDVGGLDPVEETSGVQKRLVNLGYYRGPADGEPSEDLTAAIRAFQAANGLETNGEADDATRSKLRTVHGS